MNLTISVLERPVADFPIGDPLLYVARRLADLEEPLVGRIGNRVCIDAWPCLWLRRKDFLDGIIHLRFRL